MPERFYQLFLDDEPADDALYPRLTRVEVDHRSGEAGAFALRMGLAPGDDGAWNEPDATRSPLFTKVRVEAGFRETGTEVLIEGYVTEVQAYLENPARSPWLELRGIDATVLMSLEDKTASWPNMSDSDIATRILSSYGFAPDVQRTEPIHQDADVTVVQRATDLKFLQVLAQRNGYELGVERDVRSGRVTGYFRPPVLDRPPQRPLAVAFGDASNLAWFHVRVDGLRPLNVSASQVDVKGKTTASGSSTGLALAAIGKDDLTALVGGRMASLVSPKEAAGRMLLHPGPTSDPAELAGVAQATRDEAGWLVTVTGEVESDAYGAVLRAGRPVVVKGAGPVHSGTYYVTRVTHTIGGDGTYRQLFEAKRNAVGVSGSEEFTDPLAVNR
jgi:phage protein D